MRRRIKWIVAVMLVGKMVAVATISVDFTANPIFTLSNCVRIKGSLVLDFTIDDSGQVMLDASASERNPADVIAELNRWDGVVGTVTAPSLFNTSFTFAADGWRRNNERTAYIRYDVTVDGEGPGYLGILGQNCTAIDGASSPNRNHEMLVWTLATDTADLQLYVTSFSWDAKGTTTKRSMMIFNDDKIESWYLLPDAGSMNISGYVLEDGDAITFTLPEDAIAGYGLSGFTLEVALSGDTVPTPAKAEPRNPISLGLIYY